MPVVDLFRFMNDFTSKDLVGTRSKEIATAYPEAGHAILALVNGLTGIEVTIVPGEGTLGHYLHPRVHGYETQGSRERRRLARDCILVCYAGMHAQRLFDPDADESHGAIDENNAFNLSRDFGVLPRYCSYVGDSHHLQYLHRLRKEAGRLVRQNQAPIRALAEALLESKILSGEEIRERVAKWFPKD